MIAGSFYALGHVVDLVLLLFHLDSLLVLDLEVDLVVVVIVVKLDFFARGKANFLDHGVIGIAVMEVQFRHLRVRRHVGVKVTDPTRLKVTQVP